MKYLKNFNEGNQSNQITYKDIIDLVEDNKIKLINSEKESIVGYINQMVELNKKRGVDILNNTITKSRKNNLIEIGDSFLVVFEDDKPIVIIGEYEISNAFEFGDVVICPGHDSITCYDRKTGKSETSHIR